MDKSKIVFVIHRYGLEVNGGAETHCRELAERLLQYYETEALTSCARDISWENHYQPGEELINGVRVHRFPAQRRKDQERLDMLNQDRLAGKEGADEAWIEESGPYCPGAIEYLKENQQEYKVIFFFTYSHYLTYAGIGLGLSHTIFVPLAHDEPNIYKALYRKVFGQARAFLFNTEEERKFVYSQFDVDGKPYRVTCMGIELPDLPDRSAAESPKHLIHTADNACQTMEGITGGNPCNKGQKTADEYACKDRKYGDYIIYVGRVAYTKNYAELNRYFIAYKEKHPSDLKLLVLGRINGNYQITYHDDIIYLGFVTDEEKLFYIKHAKFLVLPSKTESLSIVLLESLAQRRPVLVNGYSPVLREQCIRSNAGLYYSNYAEFEAGMEYLLNHPKEYQEMGENGSRFVRENYNWDFVLKNIISLIEEVGNK